MATPYRLKRSAISGKRPQLSDLQLGELALNFNDGYLFAERDTGGVGIGQTVTLLTPWIENLGGGSIFYENSVGVGTTTPTSALTVLGLTSTTDLFVTGVSTFVGVGTFSSNVFIDNQLFVGGVNINGGSSLGDDLTTRHLNATGFTTVASLEVSGPTSTQHLDVSGIATVGSSVTISSAGINLSGIVTSAGGFNIGIQSGGTNVTTGVITALNFVGAGNSFTYNVGTKTVDINIGGGQWTYADTSNTTESSIYRVNGNVGLGTTDPTSKLTVDGDVSITGVATATTFIGNLTGTATTATKVQTHLDSGTQTDYFIMMGDTASGDNDVRLDSGLKYHTLTNVLTVDSNINATGVVTATTFSGQVNAGVSTLGISEATNLNVTGVVTATGGLQGIGIQSAGTSVTTGIITTLNFTGSAVSTITDSSGIVEINVKAGQFTKSTSNFTATAGQTGFSVTYTPGFIDVFLNGVRLTDAEYTATNGTSVVLATGANEGDIVDIVVYQNSGLFNSSKWIETGSGDIHRLNGNVGVGTDDITSKLTVIGDTLITGIVTASGGFNIGIQSGGIDVATGVITALNFIGTGNTFSYDSGTNTIDISISSGNALSISTSTEAVAQDIAFVGGAGTSVIGIATTTSAFVYVPSTGRVGVGTTIPTASLQIGSGTSSFVVSGIGSIGIGTNTTNAPIDLSGILGMQGTVTGIQTTTATTIDTLPTATYRSARFQVQITQSTDYQSTDLMAIHNGTTASIVEYGTIATNDYLASFTSTVSGSDMLLQATMASAGIATVKVVRYGVTI